MTEISNGRTVFVDKYIEALKKRGESRIVVFIYYAIFRSEITELKSINKNNNKWSDTGKGNLRKLELDLASCLVLEV